MTEYQNSKTGFGTVGIVGAVLAVLAIGGIGVLVMNHQDKSKVAQTSPAATTDKQAQQMPSSKASTESAAQQYPGMTQYSNSKYGFSFYYPNGWRVEQTDAATTTSDIQNGEFALWIKDSNASDRPETAQVAVIKGDLAATTKAMDDFIGGEGGNAANYKSTATVAGKAAVKYVIPQSPTVDRQIYYVGVGTKTVTIQSINEESNIARNVSYLSQFNATVGSIKLQ